MIEATRGDSNGKVSTNYSDFTHPDYKIQIQDEYK